MPSETPTFKIKYSKGTDEIKSFPGEVSEPGAKTIEKVIEERTLSIKKYAAGATLKTGELAIQEKSGETFTLPAVGTANQIIGISSLVLETKITTSGGAEIRGDFLAAASCKLATNQHMLLVSDGVHWLIVAGEPKREQAYKLKTLSFNESWSPSSTRPCLCTMEINGKSGNTLAGEIKINALEFVKFKGNVAKTGGEIPFECITFKLMPGIPVEVPIAGAEAIETMHIRYIEE